MTYPELRDKCIELQRDCTEKQNELRRQYAAEHNPVKVGDIITEVWNTDEPFLDPEELRDTYLKFFESKGHKIIPGASKN